MVDIPAPWFDLLEACRELAAEHRLINMAGGTWVCPFCCASAQRIRDFPHAADCPLLAARAAIAAVDGLSLSDVRTWQG